MNFANCRNSSIQRRLQIPLQKDLDVAEAWSNRNKTEFNGIRTGHPTLGTDSGHPALLIWNLLLV